MPLDSILVSNPFTALGAIAGPAILTNACSVLTLGTGNRLSRVVDRTRLVVQDIGSLAPDDASRGALERQLQRLDERAHILLNALRAFYSALGLFAASALLSAIGSVLATYGPPTFFGAAAIAALGAGTGAVAALIRGCAQMVRETRLAIRSLQHEAGARPAI
jgi:hypothetical protein